MASTVNTRFVIALGSTLALLVVVGVLVARRTVFKSGADHFNLGTIAEVQAATTNAGMDAARAKLIAARASKDQAAIKAAAEEFKSTLSASNKAWDLARDSYSKAVSKEPTNIEYLNEYINALNHLTPQPMEQYRDVYRKAWLAAQTALSEVAPNDVKVQKAYLNLIVDGYKLGGATPSAWEAIYESAEKAMRSMNEGSPEYKTIRGFRGLARTELMASVAETRDEQAMQAKDDLLAALEADPNDGQAAAVLGNWYRIMASRSAKALNRDEAVNYMKECIVFLRSYVDQRKNIAAPLFILTQAEMSEYARTKQEELAKMALKPGAQEAMAAAMTDAMANQKATVEAMITRLEKEPAESLDRYTTFSAAATAIGADIPNARDRAMALVGKALKARPSDVFLLYKRGELEMASKDRRFDAAIDLLQEVIDLPDLPLSPDGMLLFALREQALARQADCALAMWDQSRADKDRADQWIATAAKFRTSLAAEMGENHLSVTLLDGKLAIARADYVEARRVLAAYNDNTTPPRSDVSAIKLLADVLRRLDNLPGAETQLRTALAINPQDVQARAALSMILSQLNNFEAALKELKEAEKLEPGDATIKREITKLEEIIKGANSTDPIVAAQAKCRALIEQSPPDMQGARKVVTDAVEAMKGKKWDLIAAVNLAQMAIQVDDRDLARRVVDAAKADGVDSQEIRSLSTILNSASGVNGDPNETRIELINSTPGIAEFTKCMLRAQVYRRTGQVEKARAEVAKAKELAPEDPQVIGGGFDDALADNDLVEANRLAEIGAKRDLDRMKGLIFRTRIAQAEATVAAREKREADVIRKLGDAQSLATQCVDRDPLNPLCWRLLGTVRSQARLYDKAVEAFEKALTLKQNDIETHKALIRNQLAADSESQRRGGDSEGVRSSKALDHARRAIASLPADYELADMWLVLEGAFGDANKATDRRTEQFKRNPNDRSNAIELAGLLVKNKRFDEAKPVVESVGQIKDGVALRLQAEYFAGRNDKAGAIKVFEDYIATLSEKDRGNLNIWFDYGRFVSERLGDPKAGIAIMEKVRNLQDPEKMEVDREIGDTAFTTGDFKKACEAYQRALDSVKSDDGNRLRFRIIEAQLKDQNYAQADKLCADAEAMITADAKDSKNDQTLMQLNMLRAEAKMGLSDRPGAVGYLDSAVKFGAGKVSLPFFQRGMLRLSDPLQVNDGIADLQQAVKIDPTFYAARARLSAALIQTGQCDAAIETLNQGVGADPTNGSLRKDLVLALYNCGNAKAAMQALQEAMKRSNDPLWFVMAAELYGQDGDIPRCLENYAEAIKRGLKTPQVIRPYCEKLIENKRPDEVLRVLADPEVKADELLVYLMVRARAYWMLNKRTEAGKDITTAYQMIDPKVPASLNAFFADLLLVTSRPAEALALLDQFKPAGGFPDEIRFRVVLIKLTDPALAREGLKELDELIVKFSDRKPQLIADLKFIGDNMFARRNYEVAAEVYKRTTEVAPNDPEPLNNYAYTLARFLGKAELALPLAEKAVQLAPSNPNILDTLGVVYFVLVRNDEAQKIFEKALAASAVPAEKVPVMLHLAELKFKLKEKAKADEYLEQMQRQIALDPRIAKLHAGEIDRVRRLSNAP